MNVSMQDRIRTATTRSGHGETAQKQYGDINLINALRTIYLDITSFLVHFLRYSSNIPSNRLLPDCTHVQTSPLEQSASDGFSHSSVPNHKVLPFFPSLIYHI